MPEFATNQDLKILKQTLSEYVKSNPVSIAAKGIYDRYKRCKNKLKEDNLKPSDIKDIINSIEAIIEDAHKQSEEEWERVLDQAGRWGLTKAFKLTGKFFISTIKADHLISSFPDVRKKLTSLKQYTNDFFGYMDRIDTDAILAEEELYAAQARDPRKHLHSPHSNMSASLFSRYVNDLEMNCKEFKDFFAEYATHKTNDLDTYFRENKYIESLPITTAYIRILAGIAGIKNKETDPKDNAYCEKNLFGTGFLGILFARIYHKLVEKFYGTNLPSARKKWGKPDKNNSQQEEIKAPRKASFAESAEFKEYELDEDEIEAKGGHDPDKHRASTNQYNVAKRNKDRDKYSRITGKNLGQVTSAVNEGDEGYTYFVETNKN